MHDFVLVLCRSSKSIVCDSTQVKDMRKAIEQRLCRPSHIQMRCTVEHIPCTQERRGRKACPTTARSPDQSVTAAPLSSNNHSAGSIGAIRTTRFSLNRPSSSLLKPTVPNTYPSALPYLLSIISIVALIFSLLLPIIFLTPSSFPANAAFLSSRSENRPFRPRSPKSVNEYSSATVAGPTPHSRYSSATSTPVRSLPAVQCTMQGSGSRRARCSSMVL